MPKISLVKMCCDCYLHKEGGIVAFCRLGVKVNLINLRWG